MAKNDSCSIRLVHDDVVKRVKRKLKSEEIFVRLADTFKALDDPTRVKILYALSLNELCVCDISALLDVSESAVSHQLRVLRNMRLVKFRKEGRIVYYSLCDDHILALISQGLEHVNEK
ncbi:MAG TPA: metalloregulator ArsR/SmtB family transcription factor [bacterium]|nr:metalloregulator ArsR/SmtB family transcription factor [bacterium]